MQTRSREYNSPVASYVTEVIVTSAKRYAEADRLITLLTLEKGKLNAIAKSARKPRSSLRGATETFIHATFELAEGKSLDIVRQVEIINAHLGLRENWNRLQLAGHVCEIANKMCVERVPDPLLFDFLKNALVGISNGEEGTVIRFKADLLDHMGVYPDLTGCIKCGSEKAKGNVHLDLSDQGFICDSCAKESGVYNPVPMKALYILHALQTSNDFETTDYQLLDNVDDILTTLLQSFIQSGFKTSEAAKHARNKGRQRDNIVNGSVSRESEP